MAGYPLCVYPQSLKVQVGVNYDQHSMEGAGEACETTDKKSLCINYSIDTTDGQSGSPVTNCANVNVIVGQHHVMQASIFLKGFIQ